MPFDFENDELLPAEQMSGPVLAVRERVLVADFAVRGGVHRFGGPLALDVAGALSDAPQLHRVLTLSLSDPLLSLRIDGLQELPLVYGFVYDGCRLKYRVVADGRIELIEMEPRSPETDWPYAHYPLAFPERRFNLRDDGEVDPEQVHALTWQGLEIDPAGGIVAIVPPSEAYGLSLWGDSGDAELVQVVFEIDPRARTVAVSNQCG